MITRQGLRDALEAKQVSIYFGAVVMAGVAALMLPSLPAAEEAINPALAAMLFFTFLQVPLADLGRALRHIRFLAALLVVNFALVPLLVVLLVQFLPAEPLVQIGVLLVLLTPCIDYVVTFSHLGRADARLLLAATPVLLILQMALVPVYLHGLLGAGAAELVQPEPFLHAFVWLLAIPLALAGLVQLCASRNRWAKRLSALLGIMPVPATAIVLFVVVAAVAPQIGTAADAALQVVPVYLAFAAIAPLIGWFVGRGLFGLDAPASRALAFSAGTRNSLVVLPLAFAVPGAVPVLPVVIVTQTLVELVSELVYVRLAPKLGVERGAQASEA